MVKFRVRESLREGRGDIGNHLGAKNEEIIDMTTGEPLTSPETQQ